MRERARVRTAVVIDLIAIVALLAASSLSFLNDPIAALGEHARTRASIVIDLIAIVALLVTFRHAVAANIFHSACGRAESDSS